MPLPPPPYAALNITGKPCCSQKRMASSADFTGPSVPGTTCTPAKYFTSISCKREIKSTNGFNPFLDFIGNLYFNLYLL